MSRRHMLLSSSAANLQGHFEARRKLLLSSKMPEAPSRMGQSSRESVQNAVHVASERKTKKKTSVFPPVCPHPTKRCNKKKLKDFDTPRVDFYIEQENILLCYLQKEDGSGVAVARWKSGFLSLDC
ncbi:hypothetical protein TNCT_695901 [Trichonephila clavata]|uniref:Uncharacterized protein n=1 Tax=Trichonephila clavata TaxID=2740835 RepID=A0A8X6L1I9_TRICU|nr:hypothetical protein TNCT_695901 [Trichonephila clavata]